MLGHVPHALASVSGGECPVAGEGIPSIQARRRFRGPVLLTPIRLSYPQCILGLAPMGMD